MKVNHKVIALGVGLLVLGLTRSVLADVAPPEPPPGSNPGLGGEQTQVRMAAETVVLDVQALESSSPRLAGEVAQAQVTASFTMHNLGSTAETMQVRFPLSNPSGSGDGFFNYPELTDLTVAVNQQPVPTTRITTPNPRDATDPPVAWATFEVTFPPAEDVLIEVKYTLQAEGYVPYASFTYILETGAGWQGTIGAADVIVRMPYEMSLQNVVDATGWSHTTPGGQFAGNEIRWHFENLEPTREDNFEVGVVAPYAWQAVLDARATVDAQPGDGNAWGALARAYKEIVLDKRALREDPGGVELYTLAVEAYEQATTLAPQVAKWHAGYAELLWNKFYWYDYFAPQGIDYTPLVRIVQELRTALALEAKNEQALALLNEISGAVPEAVARGELESEYVFLILTATPAPQPTQVPVVADTATPLPSDTPAPASVATRPATSTVGPTRPAANTPAPGSAPSPTCGTAIVVAPAIVGLIRARRRRS